MITAICNIYINSSEKLSILKDSFPKVYEVSDNWLVYIRGKYRKEATEFIKQLDLAKQCCTIFNSLYDNDWAKSTREMLKQSKYSCIYVFLEDHLLLKSVDYFKNVIEDMENNSIEYFQYSFFNIGISTNSAEKLYPDYTKYFYTFYLTEDNLYSMQNEYGGFYPYSLPSVCSKNYFIKLLGLEKKLILEIPLFIQKFLAKTIFFLPRNHKFWFSLKNLFSRLGLRIAVLDPASPFNLEKTLFDCNVCFLPLKIGGLREELFANWDHDNGITNSSLIKRGLYPLHLVVSNDEKEVPKTGKSYFLKKDSSHKYQYFPDFDRILQIPKKYLLVEEGSIIINSTQEVIELNQGESVWIASNIPHTLYAKQDSRVFVYITC